MDLAARMAAAALPALLGRLRFAPGDAAATVAAASAVMADDASRERLESLVGRVLAIGGRLDEVSRAAFTPADEPHPLGRGVLPLLALVATVGECVDRRLARGQSVDVALDALGDLGHQVWKHRQVTGEFGLHNQDFLSGVWADGLVWPGRLEFNIERRDGERAFFAHIPDNSGPLRPAAVDASVAVAREWLPRWYPEVAGTAIYCSSWLLDPVVVEAAGPGSNIAAFAARFGPELAAHEETRDALYFGFHRQPPTDLATLPTQTRFRQALADHLRAGGAVRVVLRELER